jgi:hypothetical protein
MAELFRVDKSGISRYLKNIFATGELSRNSVVANFATTASDGKSYQVEHYSQDEPTGVEKDYDRYKSDYLKFKGSLKQYADGL